jgi:hypothetical protein
VKDSVVDEILSLLEAATEGETLRWTRFDEAMIYSDELSTDAQRVRVGIQFCEWTAAVKTSDDVVGSLSGLGTYILAVDELDEDDAPARNIIRLDTRFLRDRHARVEVLFSRAQESLDVPAEGATAVLKLLKQLGRREET